MAKLELLLKIYFNLNNDYFSNEIDDDELVDVCGDRIGAAFESAVFLFASSLGADVSGAGFSMIGDVGGVADEPSCVFATGGCLNSSLNFFTFKHTNFL